MKVLLLAACVVALGVVCAESLNEDQLRDQLNYVSKGRSKRALCGGTSTRSAACSTCVCTTKINFSKIFGKRAANVASKRTIPVAAGCFNHNVCCNTKWPTIGAKSANAKDQASVFLKLFGKRSDDSQFKKPSIDLIFLIDDSGSISSPQFTVAKEGAATLSQAVCPHKFGSKKGEKQVSVVLFSTVAKTMLTYEQSQKGTGYVEDAILDIKQRSGSTSTASAIKYVREQVVTQPGNRLNDEDTATIVLVVTDGKCNSGCESLKEEADKLRKTGPGVQVFAFGVGEADCNELEEIRGKNAGKVFGLPDYNFFEKLANAVKEQAAKNSGEVCV